MTDNYDMAKKYKVLNELAVKGESVVLGTKYMLEFPFYELMSKNITDYIIYNRSFKQITVKESILIFEETLKHLQPKNIVLSFGENEEINDEFISCYNVLIKRIKYLYKNAGICVLDILSASDDCVKIKKIADDNGVKYVKINRICDSEKQVLEKLSGFLRNGTISFFDAMHVR